jgi:hypothetical protein
MGHPQGHLGLGVMVIEEHRQECLCHFLKVGQYIRRHRLKLVLLGG